MPSSRRKPGSTRHRHPGESRDPFAVALMGSVFAETHPCVFPSAFLADGSLLFACPKRSNPEKGHPRGRGRRASCPATKVSALRGSLTARPCAGSELGAIHRADPFGAFSFAPSPRPRGTPRSKEADLLSAEAAHRCARYKKTLAIPTATRRHSGEGRNPASRFSFVS